MGALPWFYFVSYQSDIDSALQNLREREFKAGRYFPVISFPEFPVSATSLAPGARHASIEDAIRASDANGTRSILDMKRVGERPDHGVVVAIPAARLLELYGTEHPTRKMIEQNMEFFGDLERGHGIYIVVHKDANPYEIFFAGYSYD